MTCDGNINKNNFINENDRTIISLLWHENIIESAMKGRGDEGDDESRRGKEGRGEKAGGGGRGGRKRRGGR